MSSMVRAARRVPMARGFARKYSSIILAAQSDRQWHPAHHYGNNLVQANKKAEVKRIGFLAATEAPTHSVPMSSLVPTVYGAGIGVSTNA